MFKTEALADESDPVPALKRALDPFGVADERGSWSDEHALVVSTRTVNTAESRAEQTVHICRRSGRGLVWWGRLDNRSELLAELGSFPRVAGTNVVTDQMLVAEAFDRWGQDCPRHLLGDFSFLVYEPTRQLVFLARDPLGVKPLFYHISGDSLVVATTAAVFHQLRRVRLTPSEQWIASYLLGVSMSHTEAPWPEVKKLPGGHTLMVTLARESIAASGPRRYFSFQNDQADARKRSDYWIDQYRSVLEESVRCRLRSDFKLGVETSGGIDSSTCLGFAARLSDKPLHELHAYGYILAEDESDFIYETGRMHGIANQHVFVDGDIEQVPDLSDRTLKVLGFPQERGSASFHDIFYADCERRNVRTLLSGFGGDEVVTNQGDLLYRELLAKRRYLALLSNMHGPPWQRPARAAKQLIDWQRKPVGALGKVAAERWRHTAIRRDVAEGHNLHEKFRNFHRYSDRYTSINEWAIEERLGTGLVPSRLEACTLMANARGVEYRWPLLDVRLIQQYLSTPAIEKRRGHMGRYLHRRALDGVVPEKVAWKPSKHMGGPLRTVDRRVKAVGISKFVDELHPALVAVIDRDRFINRARQAASEGAPQSGSVLFMARQEHGALKTLDSWLKTYHS